MKYFDICSDIAIESAKDDDLSRYCTSKKMDKGIVCNSLLVKTLELSKRIGKSKGVYITYDAPSNFYQDEYTLKLLSRYISTSLKSLVGNISKSSPVLIVGLGNNNIVADSLGTKTVEKIKVTRHLNDTKLQSIAAISAGVLGITGVQSSELIKGVVEQIKPSFVITIDALASSVVSRITRSFQISSAGIVPGGGVGYDKPRIDKESIGVQVISIGVPIMLSLNVAIYNFVKSYLIDIGEEVHELKIRNMLKDANLLNAIVSFKDVDFKVDILSSCIANAINMTFGNL